MTNKSYKTPPPGYSESEWRDLRHDLAQCVRAMESIGILLEKNAMPIEKAVAELKILSRQAGKVYSILFEEPSEQ